MSLSRPRIFALREVSSAAFFELDFFDGDLQFNSRSKAVILLRSRSFSNSSSCTRSSEDGCGSSWTVKSVRLFSTHKYTSGLLWNLWDKSSIFLSM